MSHKIIKCRHCDKVIMQCRCPAENKHIEFSDCGCKDNEMLQLGIPKDGAKPRKVL